MPNLLRKKTNIQNKDILIDRKNLKNLKIDVEGRDFLAGFNEPSFRFSRQDLKVGDLDSKLNARLPSYFLPLIAVARKQPVRPRLYIVSGLNMALKWNAQNDHQKTIMLIDDNLKMDFLKTFFEEFFYDNFSIIEYVVAQDPIKISDTKLLSLWNVLERRYPEEIRQLKLELAKFKRSQLFNSTELSEEAKEFLSSQNEDLIGAFKYAVAHLFVMADINFEGNYVHNPIGYVTVGGPTEKTFNSIRQLALQVLQDIADLLFEREVIYKDNLRLVVTSENHAPVPYNGYFESYGYGKKRLAEVTFENGEVLDFYNRYPRLKPDMDFLYEFIPKEQYEKFWNTYRDRYIDLKARYREAYKMIEDF